MAGEMEFNLLGPLIVRSAGLLVPVRQGRQRAVLAALLLDPGRVVRTEELAEVLWGPASPPPSANVTIRNYVKRLRQALGDAGYTRISTAPRGYRISVDPREVDVSRFEAMVTSAQAAQRDGAWEQAAARAHSALSLWRGQPLADVESEVLTLREVPRLAELRTQALEIGIGADLELGGHADVITDLRELIRAQPLREHLRVLLMLALYRSGRQAEALAAYQDARRILVEELGADPGPELRGLHERILCGDAELHTPSARTTAPRQLPAAARHFTGRQAELRTLTDLPEDTATGGGTVVILAIDGMAGIGKTALAIHAAHRLAAKFPDGQLFIDLHGHTQGHPPRTAHEALTWLLRALGVSSQRIPDDTEQAAALYRQELADSRTMIVLENAATEAQVRPLLPGGGSCLVLVTSRRRLKGLDDARVLSLDLLPAPDAVALLRAVAGLGPEPADGPLLDEVAGLCGFLPLALRIAAALLRHRPSWSLGQLAGLLREQHGRVQALSDGERDLSAVFNLSYASLDERQQCLWRRLGLIPGPDLDVYAAAALLEADPADATRRLEDLVDHNLLTSYAPGRYRLHDLLRAYARALAAAGSGPERASALDRLLRYYAHTAQSASILIARYPGPELGGNAPIHAPALAGPEAARTWLRAERDNIEAAYASARALGLHGHALALAAGLAEILRTDGPYGRAIDMYQAAAETAERHGHPVAHANALTELGMVQYLAGDLAGAGDTVSRALEICRATGDRSGEAHALIELGPVQYLTGDLAGAVDTLSRALEITRSTGNRSGEAFALAELGIARYVTGDLAGAGDALSLALEITRETGRYDDEAAVLDELGRVQRMQGDLPGAVASLSRALEIYRSTGNRIGEAFALAELGSVRYVTGDLAGAGDALSLAVEITRATGNRSGEALALAELGRVQRMQGDLPGAVASLSRALEIYRSTGNRSNEAWALNHYAAAVAASDLTRARTLYRQALTMNRELGKPDDEAAALEGLGECDLSAGESGAGTRYLRQALEIYERLGMASDTERVRTRLESVL